MSFVTYKDGVICIVYRFTTIPALWGMKLAEFIKVSRETAMI